MGSMKRIRIGEMLVMAGLIEERDLRRALVAQLARPIPLGRLLVERGAVSEASIALLLGRQLGIESVDLDRVRPEAAALARLERAQALSWGILPLRLVDRALEVALAEPDERRLSDARLVLGLDVRPRICPASVLDRAFARWYPMQV